MKVALIKLLADIKKEGYEFFEKFSSEHCLVFCKSDSEMSEVSVTYHESKKPLITVSYSCWQGLNRSYLHRDERDGPARIALDMVGHKMYEIYYRSGKVHRSGGLPARVDYIAHNKFRFYFYNNGDLKKSEIISS